jgi:capsular exopolysaccharide synthesis family protein
MKIPFLNHREEPSGMPSRASLFRSTDLIFNEQFKNFSARFEYNVDVRGLKTVAVTSSIAGEGKTVSTVNLAMNLASTGRKKVLLVDFDLRKSDLARGLRIPPRPGMAEYLSGSASLEDTIRYGLAKGLHVIPSGAQIAAPWELITGDRFRGFLKDIRDTYDVILLDTPPIVPVSDSLALREVVDGFILVYRLGYTPHTLFRRTMEDIGEPKLLGVLLNGEEPQSQRYYQRYYGKYYMKPEDGKPEDGKKEAGHAE